MNNSIQISASILCADFSNLAHEIKKSEDAGIDRFHIDVMDGHFVPNLTIGPVIVETIRPHTRLLLEAHLMIEHPWDYIDPFIEAGADIVAIHAECYGPRRAACQNYGQYPKEVDSIDNDQMRKDLKRIRARGKKAYAVLNPGTPLCIQGVLADCDGVLLMTVNPGFAKQKFMTQVLPKIEELKKIFKGDIEVDGGINDSTAAGAVQSGANVLVTASYFFSAPDPRQAVTRLKKF